MTPEELELAELVLEDLAPDLSYGQWKHTTEDLIGRGMEPTEANVAFDFVSRNRTHLVRTLGVD
jgi:hypothetical protein